MNWERNQTSARQSSAASERVGTPFGGGAGKALVVLAVVLLLVFVGVMVWSAVAPGGASWVLGLCVIPPMVIAVLLAPRVRGGYRLLEPDDTASLMSRPAWHATVQEWGVGDVVTLEQAPCQRSARVVRSDRPFTRSQQAVYLFAEPPSWDDVNGNVKGARARYLYTLALVRLDGPAYRRETAVAVAGNVVATVTSRETWTRR